MHLKVRLSEEKEKNLFGVISVDAALMSKRGNQRAPMWRNHLSRKFLIGENTLFFQIYPMKYARSQTFIIRKPYSHGPTMDSAKTEASDVYTAFDRPNRLHKPPPGRLQWKTPSHASTRIQIPCTIVFTRTTISTTPAKNSLTFSASPNAPSATGSHSTRRMASLSAQKKNAKTIYSEAHREWIYRFYVQHPLAFLDETQRAFIQQFAIVVSITSIWRIVRGLGLTRRCWRGGLCMFERATFFGSFKNSVKLAWAHANLVFLDEVSFDNRGMIRKRGFALRGKKLVVRGEYERKSRVSILAFIGADGLIDYFSTEGTFDRVEFTGCCQDFVHSSRANVQQYPGRHSVWILDGASIHRHPEIVHYLRSVGVVPVFFPAYCPFFNPIEVMFGLIKKSFQRHYVESSTRNLMPFVVQTFRRFERYNMRKIMEHCGWMQIGMFNPVRQLSNKSQVSSNEMES